jgi:O-antigen ligase
MTVASVLRRVLQVSFFAFALFVPFSIAGMNIACAFGALAWTAAALLRIPAPGASSPRSDPLALASFLLVVSALPAVVISQDSARAVKDWSSYWQLLIVFWVACNVRAVQMREAAFWTLAASSAVACGVALVQRAGGMDVGFIHIPAEFRVGGTLYTMTFAGILYQLIVLNCAVLLTRGSASRPRILLAAVVGLQFVALMLTMTRGAWVALIGGLVALCALVRNRVVTWSATGLVAAVVLFSLFNFHQQGRSIPELLRTGLDKDASTRVVLWDIAWDLFLAHPLLGVGLGDYTIEADRLLAGRKVTTTVDTHNVYLHVLATRGLVGFVPFVFFWFVWLRELFRLRRRFDPGSLDHQYTVGAIAATVAVLLGALTELNVDDSEVFMTFMFTTGLALSARTYQSPAAARRAT